MKLARKLTIALVLGIVVVMTAYTAFQIRNEVTLVDGGRERIRELVTAIQKMFDHVWNDSPDGPRRVQDLVEIMDRAVPTVRIRLVSLPVSPDEAGRSRLPPEDVAALEAGTIVTGLREDADGSEWRYTYAPITATDGSHPSAIEGRESRRVEQTYIHMSHVGIFAATLAVILACSLIVTALEVRLVGKPLELLRDKARRAGGGDFSGPLVFAQRDEIGDLARDINAMCDQIEEAYRRLAAETDARMVALEQLRHTDRLATVGQLAAGVAHELGTPLSVVSARAQLLVSTELARGEIVKSARAIVEQSDRMTEIIQELLDFSRRRPSRPLLGSLQQIVSRVADLLGPVAARAGVTIDLQLPAAPILARVDANQMLQALSNLVLNGVQAMPGGGRLRVAVGTRHGRPPVRPGEPEVDHPCVTIEDEGGGIPAEHLDRVFEPFFTTKPGGEGTGLGLPVARGIVAEHGGWIEVESEIGRGTRFSVLLQPAAGAVGERVEAAS